MSYDINDAAQVKFQKTKAHKERQNELADLKDLLQSKPLRKWLWRLLEETKIFSTTSHLPPHEMAINSGKRDIGLWVHKEILLADPEAYLLMQRESKNV